MITRGRLVGGLLVTCCAVWPALAPAQEYTFVDIASGGLSFGGFAGPSVNNAGTVAFRAGNAIFSGNGGALTRIADTDGVFSSLSSDFTTSPSIDDAGNVAFYGRLRTGAEGIFVGNGGAVIPIALGSVSGSSSASPSIANGTVAFRASIGGVEGIFTGRGGPLTTIASALGAFNGFGTVPSIDAAGMVAFLGYYRGGGAGVFAGNGGPVTTVADFRTGNYANEGGVPSISRYVLYGVTLNGNETLFAWNGVQSTAAVDTTGPYVAFFASNSINARGQIAFWARLDSGLMGIYTGPDPVAHKVLQVGDSLFGSTVTAVVLFNPRSINDAGQIALYYELASGRAGIVRADPVVRASPEEPVPLWAAAPPLIAVLLMLVTIVQRSRVDPRRIRRRSQREC